MSAEVIVAVDGGNSKTDLALVAGDGRVLALARGAGSSPHRIGTDGCVALIEGLLDQARGHAGPALPRPAAAVVLVAGADLDNEESELRAQIERRGWAERVEIGNDTLALLRAGSDSPYGVAVVCGAGINAIGVGPEGRSARFPALGPITGDWGGGGDLGLAALGAAVRAEDGRGRSTALTRLVAEHFHAADAEQVALAVHRHELEQAKLAELAPLVLAAAEQGDEVACELRERLVGEIAGFARAAAARALDGVERYDVVLGGSLLARSARLGALAVERIAAELPAADPSVCTLLPVAGSALIGLELIGAGNGAASVLRSELGYEAVPTAGTNGAPA